MKRETNPDWLRFRRPILYAKLIARAERTPKVRRGWFCLRELVDIFCRLPGGPKIDPDAAAKLIEAARLEILCGSVVACCLHSDPYASFRFAPESAGLPEFFALVIDHIWINRAAAARLVGGLGYALPDWLVQISIAAMPAGRRGRRASYDWDDIEQFARQQLETKGEFQEWDIDGGWRSQADLEKLVTEYIERTHRKPGGEPKSAVASTVREHVKPVIDRWRAAGRPRAN